jgi:3-phosphoshikimate 1-carboxyvinyltransferase
MGGSVRLHPPRAPLRGRIVLPGSKSITNRALLLAALAAGESRLTGALKSDDTRWMAQALLAMGVRVDAPDATSFRVHGAAGRLGAPSEPLHLGNAGTAMRFLTAACALADGPVVLDGDEAMRKRPIAPLVVALGDLGVSADAPTGRPPVTVRGRGGFDGVRVEIDAGLSSQYVSALLMLSACGRAPVEVALKGRDIGARATAPPGGSNLRATAPASLRSSPTPRRPPICGPAKP